MATAIAVTGSDLVLPPVDRQTPPPAVLRSPRDLPLEGALAEMDALLARHGHVIAVYASSGPAEVHRRLHTVRAVLESDRIALLPVDLPPLAVAVLALQLRQLSVCDFSPGVLASAARLLTHYVYAGALLHSVARLDRVPVSLGSHAKSWLPGAQFGALVHPTPRLVRIGAGEALEGPAFGTRLVYARGQCEADWVTRTLAPGWRVQGLQEAVLPSGSARWWGTGKLVEFAAAIADVAMLYQLVASVRREECRWCGRELIGDLCAFCSAPVTAASERTAPARRAVTRGVRALPAGQGAHQVR